MKKRIMSVWDTFYREISWEGLPDTTSLIESIKSIGLDKRRKIADLLSLAFQDLYLYLCSADIISNVCKCT